MAESCLDAAPGPLTKPAQAAHKARCPSTPGVVRLTPLHFVVTLKAARWGPSAATAVPDAHGAPVRTRLYARIATLGA
jgi:hypothetical protein